MKPDLQRLLMVVSGVACLVAIRFAPEQRELLLATGIGLLGWAKAAPGHGGGPPTAGAVATMACFGLVGASLAGCSSRPEGPPCDYAAVAGIVTECSLRAQECQAGADCESEDDCLRRLSAGASPCVAEAATAAIRAARDAGP